MNIYVGNIDFKVTEEDLRDIFEEYGSVSSTNLIKDKFTGRSKGFGFVVMEDEVIAKTAIEELNGAVLENRELIVNEAKPRKEQSGSFRRR
ncbi:MAG: RNA-binding protein [Bacteroidales bacterium]|nr:RNA-binding protein [Bacteroidales bacterium]